MCKITKHIHIMYIDAYFTKLWEYFEIAAWITGLAVDVDNRNGTNNRE